MSFEKRYRQFYDNIYGFVKLCREEYDEILHDPYFLRLHNIKQMGLCHYVFPDALHTRYSHSLGVYSIMQKIIAAQEENYLDLFKLADDDKRSILLSALLHDVGHLPLSHTIEVALERFHEEDKEEEHSDPIEGIFENDQEIPIATKVEQKGSQFPNDNLRTEKVKLEDDTKLHEELGEYVITCTALKSKVEAKLDLNVNKIASGFKGITSEVDKEEAKQNPALVFARNFLHSQLDADRIDYLLRDASFSGVRSGAFDFDKLITEIRYDDEGNYGVNYSGIRAIEQFFMSRFAAYTQIVFNKKVHGLDYMAGDFYYRLLKLRQKGDLPSDIVIYSFKDIKAMLEKKPDDFLRFTDDYFHSLVQKVDDSNIDDYTIKQYVMLLKNRTPLKSVAYEEFFATDAEFKRRDSFISYLKNPENKEKLAHSAGVQYDDIIIPQKPLKVTIFDRSVDPISIFNGEKVNKNILDCEETLLNLIIDKKLYLQRIFTFDEDKQEKIKKAMTEMSRAFNKKGNF
ncbi:hypothetical protein SDC9_69482 [bioreactor metagenome]|uniref:HD/PDEase domain-containing protein n=1 Tax=bioreactor metagenome TaxID=1076179 RepID=A0A644Y3A0_9ZZZZ